VDLLDWLGILLRRWWLTLSLFLLALGGTGAAAAITPWTYEAKAEIVFLASSFQARQAGGNPWLVFDSSLTVTAEVVGREMMDDRTAAELASKGLTAQYQVGVAPDSTGPVLTVEVTGTDARTAKATLDALVAAIPQRLTQMQAKEGVQERAQIKASVVTASPQASLAATSKLRLLVMVLFVGLVLTVAIPLFAEVLSERRRRGKDDGGGGRAAAREDRPARAAPEREPQPNGVTLPDVPIARKRSKGPATGTEPATGTGKGTRPARAAELAARRSSTPGAARYRRPGS
jgi:capsular polysaccharide biosynthesis protein